MTYLKRLLSSIRLYILKNKLNKLIFAMDVTDDHTNIVYEAIIESLKNKLTTEEKLWITRIESIRRNLDSSTEAIVVQDFGAGNSDRHLTREEMYKGRMVEKIIGDVSKKASKPYFWCILLFKLIRKYKPNSCIELGTCLGTSGAYQAAALEINGSGHLATFEGAETLAAIAETQFKQLSLKNVTIIRGRFQDKLQTYIEGKKQIDYAFIDGHHDYEATLEYFDQIIPFLSNNAIVIFDDISWSKGMKKAWRDIIKQEHVKLSFDLIKVGVCIISHI